MSVAVPPDLSWETGLPMGVYPRLPVRCQDLRMQDRGLFLGRVDEVRRFTDASEQWRGSFGGDGWPTVVLVHGLGGIGKSSLLRRLGQLCQPTDAVAWIDFEDERKLRPAAYGGDTGPGLVTTLDAIMRGCVEAMAEHGDRETAERAFDDYRVAVTRLPQILEHIRAGIAEAEQRGLTKEDIAALETTAVTVGALITHQPVAFPAAAGTVGLASEGQQSLVEACGRGSPAPPRWMRISTTSSRILRGHCPGGWAREWPCCRGIGHFWYSSTPARLC